MIRPLAIFIGIRYTRAKRNNRFISFISLASMIGLALGVAAMITVLSVMNGFQYEMSSRILGLVPHGVIHSKTPMADWPALAKRLQSDARVLAVAPYAELDGIVSYRGQMMPIQVQGILPEQQPAVSDIAMHIDRGRLDNLEAGSFRVILGRPMARRLGLTMGDELTLIVPKINADSSAVTPRMYRLTLAGTFSAGTEMDGSTGLVHIQDAAHIRGLGGSGVDGLRLKLSDVYAAPQITRQLASKLGEGYYATDWSDTQGSLFAAMHMEKTMIALLLLLIIAVAAFNIVATLIMAVADKRTDIAILRTLGSSARQVMAIFIVQGSIIGAVGTALGAVAGVSLALNVSDLVNWIERISSRHIFTSDAYLIKTLPSQLHGEDVLLVCAAGLVLSFVSTLYPAWRASKAQPAEALRYE